MDPGCPDPSAEPSCPTADQLGVICKVTESVLDPFIQII